MAITPIFATIILLGITSVLGGVLYYTFQEQIDPYLTNANVEFRNLSVVENNGRLTISGTIKSSGQIGIDAVYIEDISIGDIRINQDEKGRIVATDGTNTRYFCYDAKCSGTDAGITYTTTNSNEIESNDVKGFAVADGTGTKAIGDTANVNSEVTAGATKVFKLSLDSGAGNTPNFAEINASEKLTMTLRFEIDDDSVISDVYTARVKQG